MITRLKELYDAFFTQLGIDEVTGALATKGRQLKFATFPYVGVNYQNAKRKILFVGLDIGQDETPGYIQGFAERRDGVAHETGFNPHIAGTYMMSLFLLKDEYNWQAVWDKVKSYPTSQQATKLKNHADGENPLTYVSLSNFFKFVEIGREFRSGDSDRNYIYKEIEKRLFIDEVKIFEPDIIVFQGNSPAADVITDVKKLNFSVYKALHPSNRNPGGRQPENYVRNLREI